MVTRLIEWVKVHQYFVVVFLILTIYLVFFVFIPFVTEDQLQSWDTAGHVFAIDYLRDNLWPNYTGWNPYFYAGYPQDTFYPPLYHYLAALLSFIIGTVGAIKLIYIVSVFVLPISFYFFVRKLNFSLTESAVASALMMLPIVGYTVHTGGTLYSLFFVGLGANSLALPLLFFYLGILFNDQPNRRSFFGLTILLTAIFLTHYVVAIVASIVLVLFLALRFNRQRLLFLGRHFLITLGLLSFWLIPFLAYFSYYGGTFVVINISYFITLPMLLLLGVSLIILLYRFDQRYQFIFLLTFIFGILIFVDFSQYNLPIHSYRFIIYFLLFAFIILTKLFFNDLPSRRLLAGLAAVVLLYHLISIAQSFGDVNLNQNELYRYVNNDLGYEQPVRLVQLDGRMISFDGDVQPHIHDLRTTIARDTDNRQIKGLFIESSANGRFLAGIHANTVRGGFIWGTAPIPLGGKDYLTSDPNVLQKALDLFNINYVLINRPIENADGSQINVLKNKPPYYLYEVGDSSLIELLDYQPTTVTSNWRQAVTDWFQTDTREILVNTSRLSSLVASQFDQVEIVEISPTEDYLKLQVTADRPVPVLIKITEFPRWQAFVNGQKTEIYRAAPYLMLVYGTGEIELRYGNSIWDYLGWGITIISLLGLILVLRKKSLDFSRRLR